MDNSIKSTSDDGRLPVVVSFDVDFTLANFKHESISRLMADCLQLVLVRDLGYPADIMPATEDDAQRDAGEKCFYVFDKDNLNLIDFDRESLIRAVYFGSRQLTDDEIIEVYGIEKKLPFMPRTTKHPRFEFFGDLFICYVVGTIRRIVELKAFKKGNDKVNSLTGTALMDNIYATASVNYEFIRDSKYMNPEKVGYFYPYLITNPDKYLNNLNPSFIKLLHNPSIYPIIISNGEFGHFTAVRKALFQLGLDIFSKFKLICIDAKKPKLFTPSNSNHFTAEPQPHTAMDDGYETTDGLMFGGSMTELVKILPRHSTILHVGDSLTADMACEPVKSVLLDFGVTGGRGSEDSGEKEVVVGWSHVVHDINDPRLEEIILGYTK